MMSTKSTKSEKDMRMLRKAAAYLTWLDVLTETMQRKVSLIADDEDASDEDKQILVDTANELKNVLCDYIKQDILQSHIAQA